METFRAETALIAWTALLIEATSAGAFAQSVGVTLNGNAMTLSPPSQQRAGRVFVPLRGVFEKLGASVVYANSVINAEGNGRSVSLSVRRRPPLTVKRRTSTSHRSSWEQARTSPCASCRKRLGPP